VCVCVCVCVRALHVGMCVRVIRLNGMVQDSNR